MKAKYVIVNYEGFPMPFVFPDLPNHVDIANFISNSYRGGPIISAGFCWYNAHEDQPTWVCYGESTALKLKSREEVDAKIFNQMFRVNG